MCTFSGQLEPTECTQLVSTYYCAFFSRPKFFYLNKAASINVAAIPYQDYIIYDISIY